jgi:hypothetical protein
MLKKLLTIVILTAGLAFAQGPVYELRTYTAGEGKLDALVARFRDHTIRIFDRLHMESVGYWVPQGSKDTLIYILKHPSRAEADKNWAAFQADPEWVKARDESEKNGKLAIKVDRVWMDATAFSKLK